MAILQKLSTVEQINMASKRSRSDSPTDETEHFDVVDARPAEERASFAQMLWGDKREELRAMMVNLNVTNVRFYDTQFEGWRRIDRVTFTLLRSTFLLLVIDRAYVQLYENSTEPTMVSEATMRSSTNGNALTYTAKRLGGKIDRIVNRVFLLTTIQAALIVLREDANNNTLSMSIKSASTQPYALGAIVEQAAAQFGFTLSGTISRYNDSDTPLSFELRNYGSVTGAVYDVTWFFRRPSENAPATPTRITRPLLLATGAKTLLETTTVDGLPTLTALLADMQFTIESSRSITSETNYELVLTRDGNRYKVIIEQFRGNSVDTTVRLIELTTGRNEIVAMADLMDKHNDTLSLEVVYINSAYRGSRLCGLVVSLGFYACVVIRKAYNATPYSRVKVTIASFYPQSAFMCYSRSASRVGFTQVSFRENTGSEAMAAYQRKYLEDQSANIPNLDSRPVYIAGVQFGLPSEAAYITVDD